MSFKFYQLPLFLLLIFSSSLFSQDVPFSKGVNLTNWFQVNSPYMVQIKKYDLEDFKNIQNLGCDAIRLPVNMIAMTNGAPDFQIDEHFFVLLDSVIQWAEITDLHLILDNHTFDPEISTPPDFGVFLNKVWAQIANHYKNGYHKLYYEILNEPHGIEDDLWNNIQQSVVETIRQIDTDHYIIVGPAGWNSYNNLANMPYYNGEKLIYTFHFYDPFIFTHQGATWVDPSMDKITNIPFPYNPSTMPVMDPKYQDTWLGWAYNEYPQQGNAVFVKQLLDMAISFKNERGVPIFCGEFGVLKTHAINEERVNWYRIVREYMELNGIGWTMWDYHGDFGIFEKGSNGLFEHDLNLDLADALGLNEMDQTEFQLKPDSASFIVYDDFIGNNIFESIYTNGQLSLYANDDPKEGYHYIKWSDPKQYNHLSFDFIPNKDLSLLTDNNYSLEFWVKGDKPGSKLDLRFVDTKTGIDDDRPWRNRYVLDESLLEWDGNWHKVRIDLQDFTEQGSWDDNTWYNPIGAFDWSAIDMFEIVSEYSLQLPVNFAFDQIEITGQLLKTGSFEDAPQILIFPNPAENTIQINELTNDCDNYKIHDLNGNLITQNILGHSRILNTIQLPRGIYLISFYSKDNLIQTKRFVKQ